MEEQDLQTKAPVLLSYMREKGYSQIYIDRFRRAIKQVLELRAKNPAITYADIYRSSVKKGLAASTLRHRRSILGLIEQFDVKGILPGHVKTGFLIIKSYDLLSEEFRRAIDIFRIKEPESGKKTQPCTMNLTMPSPFSSHFKGLASGDLSRLKKGIYYLYSKVIAVHTRKMSSL